MAEIDRNVDRWLSAVVQLKPVEERAPGEERFAPETPQFDIPESIHGKAPVKAPEDTAEKAPEGVHIAPAPGATTREVKVPVSVAQVARTKQFFANSGFEVHAPVGSTFSIGGKQSTFQRFFDVELMLDETQLGSPVSTKAGETSLDLGILPEEFQQIVQSVTFPPAVEIPGLSREH